MFAPIRLVFALRSYHGGGKSTYLHSLLPRLDSERFHVTIVTEAEGSVSDELAHLGRVVVLENFERETEPLQHFLVQEPFDLAQSNGFGSSLALAAWAAGVPHLWRLGASIEAGVKERLDSSQKRSLIGCIAQLSDKIIFPSDYLAEPFRKMCPEQVVVIPNGVELGPEPERSATGDEPLEVAMIAHLLPQKRHQDFILAARQVLSLEPTTRFVVYGETYSTQESQEYARTLRNLAEGTVDFRSFQGQSRSILLDTDIVVLPSIGEGASNAILEAMAAALPVVASRSGGNPEMVIHERSGLLVPPSRPDLLANSLLRLLRSPEQRLRLGHAGRLLAARKFSATNLDRYPELYLEVLQPKQNPKGVDNPASRR